MMRALLLALVVVVGCGTPFMAYEAAPYTPPPVFQTYWRETELCTGRTGDFAQIQWFVVPSGQLFYRGEVVSGLWDAPRSIYLTHLIVERLDLYHSTVRHEIGHALGLFHVPLLDHCERGPG